MLKRRTIVAKKAPDVLKGAEKLIKKNAPKVKKATNKTDVAKDTAKVMKKKAVDKVKSTGKVETGIENAKKAKNSSTTIFSKEKVVWTATHPKGTGQTYEVYQRTDIEWEKIRTNGDKRYIGKTNAEAAQHGTAIELADGSMTTLHHLGQDSRGGLVEASTRYHGVGKYGQDILHSQYGKNKPI